MSKLRDIFFRKIVLSFLAFVTLITMGYALPEKEYPVKFKPITLKGKYMDLTLAGGVRNIFYSGRPIDLRIDISPLSPSIICFVICEIKDQDDNMIWTGGKVRIEVPYSKHSAYVNTAFRDIVKTFKMGLVRNGSYSLRLRLEDKNNNILDTLDCKIYAIRPGHSYQRLEDSFWGIRGPVIDVDLTWMMGIKWIMAEVAWPWVEPEKGEYCFSVINDAMAKYHETGFCVMPVLNKTAPWAVRTDVPKSGELTPPRDLNEWGNYAYRVINNYKDCKFWSVWEEPDCGWKRSVPEYIALLKKAYEEAKKANPDSKIIGGNPARLTQGIGNLQFYFENGLAECCDIVGIHPYVAPRSPEDAKWDEEFEKLNALIKQYGKNEIWATEVGWSTGKGGCSVSDKQQADYLVRMYLMGLATPNLKRIFWFCGSPYGVEDRWGIIEKDGNGFLHPRPALIAFAALTSLLEGYSFERKIFPLDITRCRTRCYFYKDGDDLMGVIWRSGLSTSMEVEPSNIVQITDIYGNDLPIPSKESGKMLFNIGESPIFVKFARGENVETLVAKFQQGVVARAKYEDASPLEVTMQPLTCGLKNLKYITFDIFNRSSGKKSAQIYLAGVPAGWSFSTNELSFEIDEEKSKSFRFYKKSIEKAPYNEYSFKLDSRIIADKYFAGNEFFLNFQICKYAEKPIAIDGDLSDWIDFYPVHIGYDKAQCSSLKNWYGKNDLSGIAYTAWDEKYFYFACRVTDDVFCNKHNIIYSRDCIQIAFDTGADAKRAGYDDNDFEFTIARGMDRDEVFSSWLGVKAGSRGFLTEENSGIKFKTTLVERMAPRPQEIVYELAVPLKFMGIVPGENKKMGLSIVIMDNDNIFKGGAEYGKGIIGSKDPSQFPQWIFIRE